MYEWKVYKLCVAPIGERGHGYLIHSKRCSRNMFYTFDK